MVTHDDAHEASHDTSLAAAVEEATGLKPALCYQCGKCSAGCPQADEMELRPHEIVRLVQLDRPERVLNNESIWLCLTCETCTARCPNSFDPARLIDGLREMALAREDKASRPPLRIGAFHRAFLKQIWAHGRLFEFGLVKGFKLRGGPLFADVAAGPAMLAKGKLSLLPHDIQGLEDVRRIIEACTRREEKP